MATDRSESTIQRDILAEIEAILAEPVEYDPVCPGFGTTWTKLFAPGSAATAAILAKPAVAPPTRKTVPTVGCAVQRSDTQQRRKLEWLTTPPPPLRRGQARPRPGPRITNVEKVNLDLAAIRGRPTTKPLAPPPTPANNPPASTKPPPLPITGPTAPPKATTARITAPPPPRPAPADVQPLRAEGTQLPPPIPVAVEDGHIVWVPHYHAHVSRQHKTRSGRKKWHIRFNATGSVRSIREIKPKT
ncbi:lysine-rich arabinogalactan protein 19-like [Temnothorax curvispinosus]|uniref:Lysine-rich arabinogalactan protein 19-like n=1 Tax=Temnothorax curvispinosus TaxID=300111 RepID=A0A6J1RFA2_9HYME|nr:lysine-rich arabinogalactan protein 19-like [Temnothorax curvispinosus]